jgi:hypothetical protein
LNGLGPGRGRAGLWRGCSMPCRLIARHRAHRQPQPAPTHPGRSGRKRACRLGDTTVVHGRDSGNAEACAPGCSSMSTLREASCVRSTKPLPFTGFGPPATRGRGVDDSARHNGIVMVGGLLQQRPNRRILADRHECRAFVPSLTRRDRSDLAPPSRHGATVVTGLELVHLSVFGVRKVRICWSRR